VKCTNKIALLLVYVVFITTLTGCNNKAYDIPYDPDSQIVGFTFDSSTKEASFDGFASNLCVTNENALPNGDIIPTVESAALFDISKSNTMLSKNANQKMAPASLTKVMTALIALEYGNLDDIYTASPNVEIKEKGAQLMGLKEGDRMTLSQALNALLLYSANDAGVLIAENIAGSVDAFAELMNKKAQTLGATNTHFTNPHGLNEENHFTTAYDLYLIFNEAVKYDKFVEIISKAEYSCTYKNRDGDEKKFECSNTNGYLSGSRSLPANVTVVGGKTGTTDAAGACLILLSMDSKNNKYISVILHDSDHDLLYADMSTMLSDIP